MSTPMSITSSFSATEGEIFSHPTSYRSVVGGLQYLTYTRPDLSYAVNTLSQYLQQPTVLHWKDLKRIFRYLKGTLTAGIHITAGSGQYIPNFSTDILPITDFSNADWATCKDHKKSIGGTVFI